MVSPMPGLVRAEGVHRTSPHVEKMENPHWCGLSPCLQGASRARSGHLEGP